MPPEEAGAGTMRVNIQVLTSTITTAVSQAVKEVLAAQLPGSVPLQTNQHQSSTATPDVEGLVNEVVATLTSREGTPGSVLHSSPWDSGDHPHQVFTSIGITLGARVSAKLKVKIWANEYVDFGALLSVAPPRDKLTLSMSSTGGFSGQPHLTLEPCHTTKKVTAIQQWLTTFNTFVSIYSERAAGNAQKLMKYCKVVCDLSTKSGTGFFMTNSTDI